MVSDMGPLTHLRSLTPTIHHRWGHLHAIHHPQTPSPGTQPQEGVDVQIRWFPGAMAVGLWVLDTVNGLG